MKKGLFYGAALIGTYLAVVHFQGTSSVLGSGASGVSNVVASLQGRTANSNTPVA